MIKRSNDFSRSAKATTPALAGGARAVATTESLQVIIARMRRFHIRDIQEGGSVIQKQFFCTSSVHKTY